LDGGAQIYSQRTLEYYINQIDTQFPVVFVTTILNNWRKNF